MPVLVRPSYVLGGRAMVIAYDVNTVQEYVAQAALMGPARPVLIDQFLEEATEVDVDALCDGTEVVIGGIMEHIEEAGVHSGDSSCVLPPVSLSPKILDTIREYTKRLALALKVVGLMNVQYAIQRDTVYVLEVNPRASRTVPFVSKATGVPIAKVAARLMAGKKLSDHEIAAGCSSRRFRNRGARILFREVAGVPVQQISRRGHHSGSGNALHRRSHGDFDFLRPGVRQGATRRRATSAAQGTVFMSVNDRDKKHVGPLGKELQALGFKLLATRGTAAALADSEVEAQEVFKVNEGRPNIVDLVKTGQDRSDHQHSAGARIFLRRKIYSARGDSL